MLTTADTAPDSVKAGEKFEELKGSYFKSDSDLPPGAKTTFVNYVRIKESIAKFIFYIITLNLMADITSIIALENSPCAINLDETAATPPTTNPTNAPTTIYKTSE